MTALSFQDSIDNVMRQELRRLLACCLGTKITSARVGVGLVIMLSSMLVATITGFPRRRHPCTMRDCQNGTCANVAFYSQSTIPSCLA